MPRLFGSSPTAQQRRQSHSSGLEQEENRRRSFAFMKYTPERLQRTNSSTLRTREHAKQIAMQLTEQPLAPQFDDSPFADFQPFPVTSTSMSPPASPSPVSAYNMDVIDPMQSATKRKQQTNLDAFVQRNQQRSPSVHSSVASDSHSSRQDSIHNSMPTFPSNSTMQARNVPSSSASAVSGAAARRRMRSQHKISSRSDTGAADYEILDEAPVSPYPLVRSGSFKANHLLNYTQTPRAAIGPSPTFALSPTSTRSLNSQKSFNSFSSADFDKTGFTFNAFGLDEKEVAQEVNEALQDLVQGSRPDMGFFLDDEFPVQNFDNSSHCSSPTTEVDGFIDGFRVTSVKQSPASSERSSITSTSEYTGDSRGVNRFKVQAGFHKSKPKVAPWANFERGGLPPVSPGPRASPHYARPEPGPQLFPVIPNLVTEFHAESFADDTASDYEPSSEFKTKSEVGAYSDIGVRSDVGVASDVGAKSDVAVASDVGVASDLGGNSGTGPVPLQIMGKKKNSAAQDVEDEEARRVSDLKKAWERRSQVDAEQQAQRVMRRQSTTSPLPREDIERLENKLGEQLLTPEILARKGGGTTVATLKAVKMEVTLEQKKRATECAEQRTSFASYRERLKPTQLRAEEKNNYSSAKSDFGGYNRPSSQMNAVLNKFNSQKSFESQGSYRETRSDVGSTPAFLASVKLRNTGGIAKYEEARQQSGSPHDETHSSFEFEEDPSLFDDTFDEDGNSYEEGSFYSDDELEWMQQREEQEFHSESSGEPKPKKSTYREQRELELKVERERKEAEDKANKKQERDVAALIRRRIAANKRMAVKAEAEKKKNEPTENIAIARNRLRKVSLEEIASPLPSPLTRSKPYVEKSPEFSVDEMKKTPVTDDSSKQSASVKTEALTVDTDYDWNEPTESASPNQPAPSIVTSEVDSSSTIRSSPDPVSSSNQEVQPASVMSSEGPEQSEGTSYEPQHVEEKTECPFAVGPAVVEEESIIASSKSTKNVLNALFAKRLSLPPIAAPPSSQDDSSALILMKEQQDARKLEQITIPGPVALPRRDSKAGSLPSAPSGGRPALKDDPLYSKYFKMRKVGMPIDVVKHAMTRDGMDPSVMDMDPNQPAGGVPLKEDPKYERFFRMLSMGLPMGAVQNAMLRDGLDPSVMDGDPNLPAGAGATNSTDQQEQEEARPRDTHRRTRLHWDPLRQVRSTSLWAKLDNDPELKEIDIDEEEFAQLFQAELTPSQTTKSRVGGSGKRAAVRVIESKRANNGGIVLARLKMTHDEMADAVDRM